MIKKLFLLSITVFFINISFAQYIYNDNMETIDGIEIKYKVVHSKIFDKSSPVELRLKLKNTNDFDANIIMDVEYSTGFTTRYKSGELEICIPKKSVRKGKPTGLAFELDSNDKNLFSSENAEWEFIKFEVTEVDNCRGKN